MSGMREIHDRAQYLKLKRLAKFGRSRGSAADDSTQIQELQTVAGLDLVRNLAGKSV